MTSRIHRGFHRLGVVLAVPVLLVAAWLFVLEASRPLPSDGSFMLPSEASSLRPVDFVPAALVALLGSAVYIASRAVGWVLDGFLTPGRNP